MYKKGASREGKDNAPRESKRVQRGRGFKGFGEKRRKGRF